MGQTCSQLAATGEIPVPQAGLGVNPNPSPGEVTFHLPINGAAPIDLEVFDAAGRLVRAWRGLEGPGTRPILTWDGRDGGGRDAASGVYLPGFEQARSCCDDRFSSLVRALQIAIGQTPARRPPRLPLL